MNNSMAYNRYTLRIIVIYRINLILLLNVNGFILRRQVYTTAAYIE